MDNQPTIEEARALLEQYADTEGHHAFRLKNGKIYEGYISEVRATVIVFSWAPSPFDDTDEWKKEFEIPIQDIDVSTLYW